MPTELLDKEDETEEPPAAKKESFAKHAAIYGLGTLAQQAVSMLLLPLYINRLSPADLGAISLIQKIGNVTNRCLMTTGIRLATLNFWGTGDRQTRATIAITVASFTYAVWIVSGIILFAFAGPISSILNQPPWILPIGVFAMLLNASTFMPLALMQARLESIPFVISSLVLSLSHFSVAVIGILAFDLGVWAVIAAMAVSYGGIGLILTLRELKLSRSLRQTSAN